MRQRVERLRAEIERHNHRYHVLDDPEIPDSEYDGLMTELRELEREHPALVIPESPTQRVGGAPVAAFAQVRHRTPMLSLDNAFAKEEVVAFDRRVRERLETEGEISYACEPKLDGLAVSLTYRKRLARDRGHARRRFGRRRRYAQHPDDSDHTAAPGRKGCSRPAGSSR